jgi:hypothetical protein
MLAYVRSWMMHPPSRTLASKEQELVWLSLPVWMWESYRRAGLLQRVRGGFLRDVLWGQFSLFLAVKIQDDIFDGQLADRSLIWTSDQFMLESRSAFAPHFCARDPFWKYYDRSITTSIEAIAEVDRRQSGGTRRYRSICALYPSMYRLCSIATGSVCLKAGRDADFRSASAFLDELVLAGQLVDDLEDIAEDLDRGRVNAAAAFLVPRLHDASQGDPRRAVRIVGTAMREVGALRRLFRQIHTHVHRATDSIRFLRYPAAAGFLHAYSGSLEAYEAYYLDLRRRLTS